MALLKESDLRSYVTKSSISMESLSESNIDSQEFDIFLSHSYLDKDTVFGLKEYLENYGLSVYVDWIDDNQLERDSVNSDTADLLRKRMIQCESLLFATSSNSSTSKWMPWECGYFDGVNGKIAILPISKVDEHSFKGQEYLGLYPYIDVSSSVIWINSTKSGFCSIKDWLNGKSPNS
ncbi:TIR domain-containing protein [Vibrio sp. L3-7]|uniref:TIR domain-containing protein n=1 Tax=Vibrio sp. L3-7 TaxID=2912253 RepID=UPI001F255C1B|nr:TIR domain-containing protein [Vibrio sp. L3-7]MCF7502944.1 toll/interleukin-1 receptor domain-containing protein [Vibrio sp. L3-7]